MKIPAYVIDHARADCDIFSETLAGADAETINEALSEQADTNIDLGSLQVADREAYIVACKAILTGLAS
jgi:hypothetical protein